MPTEMVTGSPRQTIGLFVGAIKLTEPALMQLVAMLLTAQLVVSTVGGGEFVGEFCCALLGVGVNQPENNKPRVKVAMINNTNIGRRLA